MARARTKARTNALADIAAGNLDRATSEIEGTVSALANVTSDRAANAAAILDRALRHVAEARGLVIQVFEQDF